MPSRICAKRRRDRAHQQLDASLHQVDDRLCGAAIRHMHHPDVGHLLQQRAGQMRDAAGTGRCIIERVGFRLRKRDQLLDILRGKLRRRQDHHRRAADHHHRREVLHRVIGRLGLQRGRGGMRGRVGEPHGVAVGLGAGDRLAAERGAGADPVVDHDLLAKPLGQPLAHDPGDDVGAAARLERHDQPDRPLRRPPAIGGRLRRSGAHREQCGKKSKCNLGHDDCLPRRGILS